MDDSRGRANAVSSPTGFAFRIRKDGSVDVTHQGRAAVVLRGQRADEFLAEIAACSSMSESEAAEAIQQVLARLTGNYRRGNERRARQHPRNRT